MVQLHAAIATLPAPRITRDVDCALHLETRAVSFPQAAQLLQDAGFRLNTDTRYAYRFDRDHERIDLMCSDRYGVRRKPRYDGRPLFGIPGGTRALRETINVDAATVSGGVRLVIPSIKGALVLKGAALQEDSRDRDRHAEDCVLLLACSIEPDELTRNLSPRSRARLRTAVRTLDENRSPWLAHDAMVQALAQEALESVSAALA
jgi:hypothetical protein